MGAWGSGTFENDDAVDWLDDLAGGDTDVASALDQVARLRPDEYLEAPEAACALAAAELVAAAMGRASSDLPPSAERLVSAHVDLSQDDLPEIARAAVVRVRDRSELQELWEEAGDPSWLEAVADLERRLGSD